MRLSTQRLTKMALVLALLVVTAKVFIPIPFGDVISAQTLVIFLLFPLLGWRDGSLTIGTYLIAGLVGLPIFATGGGLFYIFKPTFGFLIAFALMPSFAAITRRCCHADHWWQRLIANYLCLVLVHTLGFAYKCLILTTTIAHTEAINGLLLSSSLLDLLVDAVAIAGVTALEQAILAATGQLKNRPHR